MQEMDLVPLFQSKRLKRIIVDSRSACVAEAGEVQRLLKEAGIPEDDEKWLPELGQLLNEAGSPSAETDDDVTVL